MRRTMSLDAAFQPKERRGPPRPLPPPLPPRRIGTYDLFTKETQTNMDNTLIELDLTGSDSQTEELSDTSTLDELWDRLNKFVKPSAQLTQKYKEFTYRKEFNSKSEIIKKILGYLETLSEEPPQEKGFFAERVIHYLAFDFDLRSD